MFVGFCNGLEDVVRIDLEPRMPGCLARIVGSAHADKATASQAPPLRS